MSMTTRQKLERTRTGYEAEKKVHRFLLDAYTGEGGFGGRFRADHDTLGGAHACYGAGAVESYLDRYKREDDEKFSNRDKVSYYLNYVEAITDLKIAFMLAKPFSAENLPEKIAAWRQNVDGQGTTMDRARLRASTRAAIFGYCPTIVDSDPTPANVTTAAQAKEAGLTGPRLTLLFPANLTQWQANGADISWVKIRTDHCELANPLDEEAREYARIDVWETPSAKTVTVSTYELDKKSQGEPGSPRVIPTDGPRIPLAILRHKEAEDNAIVGLPMHAQVSKVARRLFNVCSELDENQRAFAFPILVMALGITQKDDEENGDSEVVIGTDNALSLNEEASQKHYLMGPPANIAESQLKLIEFLIREIYRMARTEHVRPAGVADATGIARRYAFAATNAAIAAFAANVALWEREVYVLVGRVLGISEDELDKIRVVAPTEFDIEDLDAEIKHALDSITASLGATATKAIKSRLAKQLLPNADEKTLAKIDEELEQAAVEDEADKAFDQSAGKPVPPGQKPAPEDEPDDEEDEEDDE